MTATSTWPRLPTPAAPGCIGCLRRAAPVVSGVFMAWIGVDCATPVQPKAAAFFDRGATVTLQRPGADLATAIRTDVNSPTLVGSTATEQRELKALYGMGAYAPLWVGDAALPGPAAHEALSLLRESRNEGLDPADYASEELDRRLSGLAIGRLPTGPVVLRPGDAYVGRVRYIVINIPMFRLWAWDFMPQDGTSSLGMRVIVGRALKTPTPVFDAELREVLFRPYWNVPRSILRNEILPALRRDPGYLDREDMEIVRGPGDDATRVALTNENLALLQQGKLRLRQRPGPSNALGLVKFVFPNEAEVYMHGTPAQRLFAQSRRDFSHGCVRVEDPVSLAEWALKGNQEWTRERILSAMAGTRTFGVHLAQPIRVLLFYTTAVVMPEDGTVRFAEDIYRLDARLEQALARRHSVR